MSSLDKPLADRVSAQLAAGALARSAIGERERELWLRSQISQPVRLLPGEQPDGSPSPQAPQDVLVLDPADVPASRSATVGPGPLVCPLDLRPRAAAALAGFLSMSSPPLREAVLDGSGWSIDAARGHVAEVMAQLGSGSVHVISSTWSVPLPWFALVEPDERQLTLGPPGMSPDTSDDASDGGVDGAEDSPDGAEASDGNGVAERALFWRSPMADVRRRTARALTVVRDTLGEEGPAAVLRDTARWLENFHPHSAVELDYGGLVRLMDDEQLRTDTSAQDVHAIVTAMAAGEADEVGARYDRLRDFWGNLAAYERAN